MYIQNEQREIYYYFKRILSQIKFFFLHSSKLRRPEHFRLLAFVQLTLTRSPGAHRRRRKKMFGSMVTNV